MAWARSLRHPDSFRCKLIIVHTISLTIKDVDKIPMDAAHLPNGMLVPASDRSQCFRIS